MLNLLLDSFHEDGEFVRIKRSSGVRVPIPYGTEKFTSSNIIKNLVYKTNHQGQRTRFKKFETLATSTNMLGGDQQDGQEGPWRIVPHRSRHAGSLEP
jgi:hypothetical protein